MIGQPLSSIGGIFGKTRGIIITTGGILAKTRGIIIVTGEIIAKTREISFKSEGGILEIPHAMIL